MECSAFSDLPGSRCHDRLRSPDRKSQKLPYGCCSTVRYLCGLFPGNLYGIQRKSCGSNFHYRRCRRTDFYFPGRQAGTVGTYGSHCRGGIFLYVPGSYHSAAYYETPYNRGRKKNQDGAAPSGFQTGKDFVPYRYYGSGMPDPAYYRSSGWYADAWKSVP